MGKATPVDLRENLLCRGNGVMSGDRVVKRCAEDRQKAVAKKFVDEAAM